MSIDVTVHAGSGNIFRDMRMPDADERLANAECIRQIRRYMRSHAVSPADAAAMASLAETDLADALRGRYSREMAERMRQLATALRID